MGANQSSGKRTCSEPPRAPPAKIQKIQKTFEAQEDSESDEEIQEQNTDDGKMNNNQEEEEEAEDEESDEEKEEDEEEKPANPLLVVVTEAVAEQVKEFVKKDHEGGNEELSNGSSDEKRLRSDVLEIMHTPVTSDELKQLQIYIRKTWLACGDADDADEENKLEEAFCEAVDKFWDLKKIEDDKKSEESETQEDLQKAKEPSSQGAEVLQKNHDASEVSTANKNEKAEINGNEAINN